MHKLVISLLLLCAAGLRGQSDALVGAGSTFAAPLYDKWIASFSAQKPGLPIQFKAVGSGVGLNRLEKSEVDFAASDFLPDSAFSQRVSVKILPTVVGGVVPAYNIPGLRGELRFTANVLAAIYLGTITRWDDPQITAINRNLKLPSAAIVPLHRSDVSGSTLVWTEFLSTNDVWRNKLGAHSSIEWPGGKSAERNEGLADLLAQTPYSIGYVELIYAVHRHLSFGAVQNAAGKFIRADIDSLTAAAQTLSATPQSLVNCPGHDAYPIASLTWLLIPSAIDAAKRARMTDFLDWTLSSGQHEAAALGYIALPDRVAQDARAALKQLWTK